MKSRKLMTAGLTLALGLGGVGCATHTGNGALLGGAGGALAGAAIGSLSHQRAGEGALLGGALGAIGGAIVGNEMDKQEHPPRYADSGYAEPRYAEPRYAEPGYSRVEVHTHYYDDGPVYYRRVYPPRYRYYDECGPRRYAYRHYEYD